jgi:hypothetical protein
MHPVFTQEMARQHREELLRRAAIEQAALHLSEQENSKGFRWVFAFLEPLHDMSTLLSRRPVIIQRRKYSDIDFDEIKHELQVTFAAMRKVGSECDDHFIEVFIRKLRRELPSAGELLLVKIPTPGQHQGIIMGDHSTSLMHVKVWKIFNLVWVLVPQRL